MGDYFEYNLQIMEDIRIRNLSKEYFTAAGSVFAVRNLSLTILSGSVFGFLGPNGAGKTTTMKMLVGLERPTEGEVIVCGGSPSDIAVRRNLGFMPESPSFYLYLTGREFLQFVADIFDIKNAKERIDEVLSLVELLGRENRQIRTYSKGMLQRLGLAQALINDPQILFLDEPLDGLDPLGRAEIKKIIFSLKSKGKTIFLNSHILADVAEVCDTVGIIDKGVLLTHDAPVVIAKGYADLEDAFVHIIHSERAKTQ
jgi:ABC-2 type transport system ATP-binding protein